MVKSELSKLTAKADKVFSLYIRKRDSTEYIRGEILDEPAGECITCNKLIPAKQAHAGHFVQRGCKLTRYDEENVNLQCSGCNTFRYGEQYKHGRAIDMKYGDGTADRLMALEAEYKANGHKFTRDFLQDIIERYKT